MVTAAERPRIEAMWVVHLMLTLAALYAVIIAGMFFAQTRLLFPTMVAGAARVQLPASTQRIEVRTHDGDRLAGVRIPAQGTTADAAPTLLGFGGNAWNAEATALTLHALFPNRNVVAFHYRGYAPSSGRPSAQALFSDSLVIYDHLLQTQAGERILPVGFSIGAAIAAYLARHRSVAGLILVTPFDSLEAVARDLYWWAPVGLLIRNRMPTIEFVRGSNVPTALRSTTQSRRSGGARLCERRSGTSCSNAPSTQGTTIFATILTSQRRRKRRLQGSRRLPAKRANARGLKLTLGARPDWLLNDRNRPSSAVPGFARGTE